MSGRRVLVVAYYFPPLGGVGVQRTLKFVEHLPAAGWDPVVLAPRGATYRVMDPSLLERLPSDLEVHRALCVEPATIRAAARHAVRRARRLVAWGRVGATASSSAGAGADDLPRGIGPRRWLNASWRAWVRACFVPDEQMAWIPVAARAGARIDRRRPVQVLYSSSPPPLRTLPPGSSSRSRVARGWLISATRGSAMHSQRDAQRCTSARSAGWSDGS